MNKVAKEELGRRRWITFDILPRTVASAARGVVSGVGKTRHIDTLELWLQNATRNQELEVQRVAGEENVAAFLTKNVQSEVLEEHLAEVGDHQDNKTRDVSRVDGCT